MKLIVVPRSSALPARCTGPSGAPFQKYEVHRSLTRQFTPSADTLLATITDPNVTTYRDTTAAPATTFTYKVITNGTESSGEWTVTTPDAGKARATLQPNAADMAATYADYGWEGCENYGAENDLRVGTQNGVVSRPS